MSESDASKRFSVPFELVVDKTIDFILIFVGLYAAMAVDRYLAEQREHEEYLALLADFRTELVANRKQHESIVKDLGPLTETVRGKVLGPMEATFQRFDAEMREDEETVHCLHKQYVSRGGRGKKSAPLPAGCAERLKKFEQVAKAKHADGAPPFEPAVLSPFYRYEVWELYVAGGTRIFKNKELAVKIGEIYNNARLIEKQVAEIERAYNDVFMKQVGRMAASEVELLELVEDAEANHDLSPTELIELVHIREAMEDERYDVLESKSVLEARVRRMKSTAHATNDEIDHVAELISKELGEKKG
jgi:hypothetical protein